QAAAQTSSTSDAASLVFVVRNPIARTGVLYLQDMRGATVSEIRGSLEAGKPGAFADALRGVTVLNGLGHHFGLASGQEPADVAGMRTLVQTLLQVNRELTIVVQTDARAFESAAPTAPRSSPLLRFAQSIGARVFLVLEGTSDLIVMSDMTVQVRGSDVMQADAEATAAESLRRLMELEQARITLESRGEFGLRELELGGTAGQALADVNAEISRLSGLRRELTQRAALTFHEESMGRAPTAGATAAILAEAGPGAAASPPRPLAAIQADLAATSGPQFTPDVRGRLRAAGQARSVYGLESALAGTPTAVADRLRELPPPVRDAIDAAYRDVREAALHDGPPSSERLDRLERQVRGLREQLDSARQRLAADARGPLDAQITALDGALGQITTDQRLAVTHREISAAIEGLRAEAEPTSSGTVRLVDALTRHADTLQRSLTSLPEGAPPARRAWITEELERVNRAINEALGVPGASTARSRAPGSGAVITTRVVPFPRATARVADVTGRGFGALMIYHSIEGLDRTIEGFEEGNLNTAQAVAGVAHAGGSLTLGVRMLRGRPVGVGSFAILSLIDVVGTMAGDYETDEAWNRAFWTSVTRNTVQLAAIGISQWLTRALVPRLGPLGVGIGAAITLVVDPILDGLGVYDFIERSTDFLPGDVADVQINLRRHVEDYRVAVGALQLAARSEAELASMGAD
ncbi:MAG TPA: hypothetical protein PKA64_22185, partial [Myxococcota bacterium]|nr:hypothetical protein [Myxococcota bacterium]